MSEQKKKVYRIKVDRENKFDPGNYHPDRNYNPNNHERITDEIIDFYIDILLHFWVYFKLYL